MNYVGVKFFAEYQQTYTYKTERTNIKKGDYVIVDAPAGKQVVKVVQIGLKQPSFECKEIIKKVRL